MPAAPPELVFRSRVNLWIVLILAGLLGSLLTGVLLALAGDELEAGMAFAVLLVYVGLVVVVVLPVRYLLTGEDLVIEPDLASHRIPYSRIERVRRARNPLYLDVGSFERIGIEYRKGLGRYAAVAPAHPRAFLAALRERAGLMPRGDELLGAEHRPSHPD
ncbi:MAG TPA: PH domain-containing protein [Longimicrobiaceae bacterium]|nr:PH domain-containing protein [Longimicrobiaceae bacterium]